MILQGNNQNMTLLLCCCASVVLELYYYSALPTQTLVDQKQHSNEWGIEKFTHTQTPCDTHTNRRANRYDKQMKRTYRHASKVFDHLVFVIRRDGRLASMQRILASMSNVGKLGKSSLLVR